MTNPMHAYTVGELYNPSRTRWPEVAQYNYRGGEHELILFFNQPSPAEIRDVQKGEAEFRLFVQHDQIILVWRFGRIPWSDAPYTIHRVPESERVLPQPPRDIQNLRVFLHIVLVDADSGVIRALRAITLSSEFTAALHAAILDQAALPWDAVGYDLRLRTIQDRYTSADLAQRARMRFRSSPV